MPSITEALALARHQLAAVSDTAKLDAELLLLATLQADRTFLYRHPEQQLTPIQQQQFSQLLTKRGQGMPIAYLLGQREFWTFMLKVTEHTLIPRPETEHLVQAVLDMVEAKPATLLELGTGSGAIALALALERPQWQLWATDLSAEALAVASYNRAQLQLDASRVMFYQGSWYEAIDGIHAPCEQFAAIVSNPPYIAAGDPNLAHGDVRFEPRHALVAASEGLADIEMIISGAWLWLQPRGVVALEHGFAQGLVVRELLQRYGFIEVITLQDYAGHDRVSVGRKV